ncbi:hypothetical protein T4D_13307 [Trichinella pseudospiralis]|uniref:Uncharacterized protein n=1 Tax=Trichinella pseudospiralis TaxID=6337 RepID=A0A0V1FTE1_TRIPS|nr:hypothetical protein T4D_13307 [Trichinella pseudospiralis]
MQRLEILPSSIQCNFPYFNDFIAQELRVGELFVVRAKWKKERRPHPTLCSDSGIFTGPSISSYWNGGN